MKQPLSRKSKKKLYLEASKYFTDLSKLVFGGIILAGIMKEDIYVAWLLVVGLIVVSILLWTGYLLFKMGNKN